jgi:FkbM family methyltransferase
MNRLSSAITTRAAIYSFPALNALGIKRVVKTLDCGFRVSLRTNDSFGLRLIVEDRFEPAVRRFMRNTIRPGMTVLDVGANLGYYSLEVSALVGPKGRVVAFEPQQQMVSEILANVKRNNLQNITVCPIALCDETGEKTFCFPVLGDEAMGSLKCNGRATILRTATVRCSTLDKILPELGVEKVDLVKLDVEGAELSVLEGGLGLFTGVHRPIVLFEANEENCAPFGHTVYDLLCRFNQLGYTLKQLDAEEWCATPR